MICNKQQIIVGFFLIKSKNVIILPEVFSTYIVNVVTYTVEFIYTILAFSVYPDLIFHVIFSVLVFFFNQFFFY